MKCGEICARSAFTSASARRAREASSSASSSCPDTHVATSEVARTRPAGAASSNAASAPTTRPSTTSGASTAYRMGQPASGHATRSGPTTCGRPAARSVVASAGAEGACRSCSPDQATSRSVSTSATPRAPSRVRRCRAADPAVSGSRPRRRSGAANDAVWRVWKVARSALEPRSRLPRTTRHSVTPGTTTITTTAAASSSASRMAAR